MHYPRIEPTTFEAAVGYVNHYTVPCSPLQGLQGHGSQIPDRILLISRYQWISVQNPTL
jgi:hypothetical protein